MTEIGVEKSHFWKLNDCIKTQVKDCNDKKETVFPLRFPYRYYTAIADKINRRWQPACTLSHLFLEYFWRTIEYSFERMLYCINKYD